MKRVLYIFLVMISGFCVSLKSQTDNSRLGWLEVLEVENESLLPILDSIIKHEQQCVYYTPDLIFSIHTRKLNDSSIEIQIGGIGSIITEYDLNRGCFEFGGHLFLVNDEYSDIFEKTKIVKRITYHIETDSIILIYDDDTYSFWIYQYINNEFFLRETHDPYCKYQTHFP